MSNNGTPWLSTSRWRLLLPFPRSVGFDPRNCFASGVVIIAPSTLCQRHAMPRMASCSAKLAFHSASSKPAYSQSRNRLCAALALPNRCQKGDVTTHDSARLAKAALDTPMRAWGGRRAPSDCDPRPSPGLAAECVESRLSETLRLPLGGQQFGVRKARVHQLAFLRHHAIGLRAGQPVEQGGHTLERKGSGISGGEIDATDVRVIGQQGASCCLRTRLCEKSIPFLWKKSCEVLHISRQSVTFEFTLANPSKGGDAKPPV